MAADPKLRQRFGYVVFTAPDTFDARVWRDATAENLAELEELTAVLFEVQPMMFAMEVVERSFNELLVAVEDHNEELRVAPRATLALTHVEGFISISHRITNFLAAVSAFLGTCETQLGRQHGKGSAEFQTWDKKKKGLHAKYFEYRFVYALRNFGQHANLPLSELKSSANAEPDGRAMLVSTGVLLNRDKLLADSHDWPPKLITEIQSLQAEFDLMPLVEVYLNCIRRLCLDAITIKAARLLELGRYLGVVMKSLHVPEGGLPVVFLGEDVAPGYLPAQHRLIPIQQHKWVEDEVRYLLEVCTIPTVGVD